MSAAFLEAVTRAVARTVGLRAEAGWAPAIAEAIEACVPGRDAGAIERDAELQARIVTEVARRVTVPESHFFRHHAQLEACCEHAAQVTRSEGRTARLWCAGAAGGEEPYTLALLLHRRHGAPLGAGFEITASDLNPDVVAKARAAIYTEWSFRGAPPWCFEYFDAPSPGQRRLANPDVLAAVRFTEESCQRGADRQADASVDVVLFRNVAIYLEDDAIAAMHRRFARILRPGGILAMGASDPSPPPRDFDPLGYRDHAPLFVRRERPRTEPPTRVAPRAAPPLPPPAARPRPRVVEHRSDPEPRRELARAGATSVAPSAATGLDAQHAMALQHLERGEAEAAVAVLRRALFLAPHDALTRHFHAIALWESGDHRGALRQLDRLTTSLGALAPSERLSDGITSAGDLLRGAAFLARQWR